MPGLQQVNSFMAHNFSSVKDLPVSYKPKYACRVIEKVYSAALYALT
jgi:hypothetical protein